MPALRPAPLAAALAATFLLTAVARPARAQERHVLTGPTATIWNLAGEIRLEAGSGSDVVVELTRGGSDGRRLDVVAAGGQLKVRYPDDQVVYRRGVGNDRGSTTVNVRSDGTFNGEWRSGGRRTTVRTSGSGMDAHADLVIRVPAGKRVEVYLALGSVEATNVQGDLRLDVAAASIRTSGTKGALSIDAGSGSVSVVNATGDIDLDTGSGSLTVSGTTGTRLILDSGSGGVEVRDVTADRVSIDVGSGSVHSGPIATDDLMVDTGSGSVRLELTKVPRRTTIESGSGGVTLTLPTGANAELDVDTGSGSITSDFPVTMDQIRRRELRGRIGTGGPLIRIETGSGSVRILKR